jgi:two-component system, cell cycle sensor histidine kinase and response regulator CckA
VRFLHRVSATREGLPARPAPSSSTAPGRGFVGRQRAAEIRFTRFFNSTPMAIAGVDAEGRILRTNAPFLSLFSRVVDRDSVDRRVRFETVLHERDRAEFAAALEAPASSRPTSRRSIPSCRATRSATCASTSTRWPTGQRMEAEEAAIVYAVDITEQKALEAQMAQSQKMQAVGQLAGGIAHDFNNVLTAIIMASDLLLTNHRPSDPSFPDIMNIKQNANRAASLVRQLLAFSRKQTLRPEVLNLTDVLADLRMLLARLVGNEIDARPRSRPRSVAGQGRYRPVRAGRRQHRRQRPRRHADGGEAHVRTATSSRSRMRLLRPANCRRPITCWSRSDTGTGIAPDVLAKIFEPFFTTKDVGKGTGLGLSMVYGIIKQTGGFIFCDSDHRPGHDLPHLPAAPCPTARGGRRPRAAGRPGKEAGAISPAGHGAPRRGRGRRALGGVRALASRGYTVHEASSGVEALEIFEELEGKVDIVVSDVVMPEMDGPTLLSELRKVQPDIKFIFVSGYAEDAFAKNLPEDARNSASCPNPSRSSSWPPWSRRCWKTTCGWKSLSPESGHRFRDNDMRLGEAPPQEGAPPCPFDKNG